MNNEKTLARLAAIQTVYSCNIDDKQSIDNVLDLTAEEIKRDYGKFKKSHTKNLVDLVIENENDLNDLVEKLSSNSDKTQANPLITSILQVAFAELMSDQKTDRNIILSEYVNLTSNFFENRETGYVNALLDKYTKQA